MNFKQATDALLESVTLEDLANEIGVSVQAVRQARAAEGTTSHRPPPVGWEAAIEKIAQSRQEYFKKLANSIVKFTGGALHR